MITISPTEKHPRYWYGDHMRSIPMPDGMRRLLCPFCPFYVDSKGFHLDQELLNHIEEDHPDNVESVYEKFHTPIGEKEQKTLEGFQ